MQIRQATLEDIPGISNVISVLDYKDLQPSNPDSIQTHVAGDHYFVAEEKGTIVGALCLLIVEQSAEIYALASRQPGAGSALVAHVEKICKDKGIPKLWAWSLKHYKAEGFYTKIGFTEQILLRKQWFNEDCWFFGKVI